jgi:tetratricopeptide (TPR) repeat protein
MKQDEFVSWMTRAILWTEENSTKVLMGLGGLVFAVLVVIGATSWISLRGDKAYASLARVQKVVRTPLVNEPDSGPGAFPTARERSSNVLEEADRMLEAHSRGQAANWARYYRAVALLDLGRAEEASAAASEVVERAGSRTLLGGLAGVVAGQAEESRSNFQAAADHYGSAAENDSSGFPPELALLHQARCLENLGREQDATDIYQKVLDTYPDSPLADRASGRLQELRAVPSPQGL